VYKQKRELLINLIHAKELAEAGLLKEYAMFLYMKSGFKNSCIYNYTQQGLSIKFNISRPAVKKHISLFLKMGWCRLHGNNLIFNKLKNIDSNKHKQRFVLEISETGKVKEIVYNLRLKILHLLQSNFNKLKKLRFDYNHAKDSRTLNAAKRLLRRIGSNLKSLPSQNEQLKISMNYFAKMFNCSIASAHGIVASFKKNGDVQCIGGLRKYIMTSSDPAIIKGALCNAGYYYRNGNVYKSECNQYIF